MPRASTAKQPDAKKSSTSKKRSTKAKGNGAVKDDENPFDITSGGEEQSIPEAGKQADEPTVEDDDNVIVDENSQGDRYLPTMEQVVPKKLYKLAADVKARRDAMISAKNEYVEVRDMLIDLMQTKEVPEFRLDTGEIVQLTDKVNVKISKKKTTMSDIDSDELDID